MIWAALTWTFLIVFSVSTYKAVDTFVHNGKLELLLISSAVSIISLFVFILFALIYSDYKKKKLN